MRRWLIGISATVFCLILWTAFVIIGTLDGWWRTSLAAPGNPRAFMDAAIDAIDAKSRGNIAFRLIEAGTVFDEHMLSRGLPIDRDTLFQVASLSKWISAWGVMTLVEAGKLDLDVPVSTYLTRWSLPESEFDNDGVTIRRLLSHTAGLTDGLGYEGFAPGTEVQSLEESLTHAADASPGHDGRVRVGVAPGSEWRYSGGGYTLLQLLIEEATGASFASYMQRAVFQRLGMERSTFIVDETTPNVATLYDADGNEATRRRFTSLAATSLYTTASDMTRFIQAHVAGAGGEPPGRGVLSAATLELMRQPHGSQMGADIWGLGTMLYAPNDSGGFVIGHDGDDEPATNTAARLDPATGDGIVVLETGNELLATTIAGEWVFWKTGNVDFLTITMETETTLRIVLAGYVVIVLAAVFIGWRRRTKKLTLIGT